MRPTLSRLVQIIPREALNVPKRKIIPRPIHSQEEFKQPTTFDLLLQQREKAGESWPSNIRLERAVRKKELKPVRPELRVTLKKMLNTES